MVWLRGLTERGVGTLKNLPTGVTIPVPAWATQLSSGVDWDDPNNADWAQPQIAPLAADTISASLDVRTFTNLSITGVGTRFFIPPAATAIRFTLVHRGSTAAGGTAILQAYTRSVVNPSGGIPAWSAALALATVGLPANTQWQTTTFTLTLVALGLVANRAAQMELVRNGGTFAAGWVLWMANIEFVG